MRVLRFRPWVCLGSAFKGSRGSAFAVLGLAHLGFGRLRSSVSMRGSRVQASKGNMVQGLDVERLRDPSLSVKGVT